MDKCAQNTGKSTKNVTIKGITKEISKKQLKKSYKDRVHGSSKPSHK